MGLRKYPVKPDHLISFFPKLSLGNYPVRPKPHTPHLFSPPPLFQLRGLVTPFLFVFTEKPHHSQIEKGAPL